MGLHESESLEHAAHLVHLSGNGEQDTLCKL